MNNFFQMVSLMLPPFDVKQNTELPEDLHLVEIFRNERWAFELLDVYPPLRQRRGEDAVFIFLNECDAILWQVQIEQAREMVAKREVNTVMAAVSHWFSHHRHIADDDARVP